jgi:hypothetical protein
LALADARRSRSREALPSETKIAHCRSRTPARQFGDGELRQQFSDDLKADLLEVAEDGFGAALEGVLIEPGQGADAL